MANINDVLYGTASNDRIFGKAGKDLLYGKAGKDLLRGGAGNDFLYGGSGNDTIWGGADNDLLYGQADNDLLRGEAGNDTIFGGAGNDTIWGGAGNDLLYGGAGKDFFVSIAGNDTIFGGADNDKLMKFTRFDVTVTDTQIVSAVESVTFNSIEVVSIVAFPLKDYNIDATALTIRGELQGSTGNDKIQGGSGNDELRGHRGSDTLIGNGGNDTLDGTILGLSSPTDIDVLTSNNQVDRDLFVLGRTSGHNKVFYLDSGIAPNSGNATYARITDFDIIDSPGELATQVDRIQLSGAANDYRLAMTTVNGQTGVGIYKKEGSVSNLLDDDLIGLVQGNGVNLNTLNLTDNTQFVYVV